MTHTERRLLRLIGLQRSFVCGDGFVHVELGDDGLWRVCHGRHALEIEDERFESLDAAMEAVEEVLVESVWENGKREFVAARETT